MIEDKNIYFIYVFYIEHAGLKYKTHHVNVAKRVFVKNIKSTIPNGFANI